MLKGKLPSEVTVVDHLSRSHGPASWRSSIVKATVIDPYYAGPRPAKRRGRLLLVKSGP